MKKLSEYRDEEALDLLADILGPVTEIMQDEEVRKIFDKGSNKTLANAVALVIKRHKRAVMDVMAAFDGVAPEEYHCDLLSLPKKVFELANDPDLRAFFALQGQKDSKRDSGSATDSTQEEGGSDIS